MIPNSALMFWLLYIFILLFNVKYKNEDLYLMREQITTILSTNYTSHIEYYI